jgi:drug/metabolite transporter (DMT)-like permease
MCFSVYTLTNTFVLSKVSVGQHTGLNALRRMFVIVFTAIVFGVPITPMKTLGILLCFIGFSAFSYYRNRNLEPEKKQAVPEPSYANAMHVPLLPFVRGVHEHGT